MKLFQILFLLLKKQLQENSWQIKPRVAWKEIQQVSLESYLNFVQKVIFLGFTSLVNKKKFASNNMLLIV